MRERNLCMAARRAHIIIRALELVRAGALIGGGKVRGDGYRGWRSPAKGRFAGLQAMSWPALQRHPRAPHAPTSRAPPHSPDDGHRQSAGGRGDARRALPPLYERGARFLGIVASLVPRLTACPIRRLSAASGAVAWRKGAPPPRTRSSLIALYVSSGTATPNASR